MAVLIDALLIAAAIFLIVRAARRGLVLSLCGFLAVILALLGARYAVNTFAPTVADRLSGSFEQAITAQLEERLVSGEAERETIEQAIPEIVQGYGFYEQAAQQIAQLVSEALEGLVEDLLPVAAAQTARLVAQTAAELLVFCAAFVLLLLVCWLLGRLLNAVVQLPLLRQCNALGGAVFGVAKAALLLLIFAWLVRYAGLFVPEQTVQQTYVLRYLVQLIS